MKKYLVLFVIFNFLVSCGSKDKMERQMEAIPLEIKTERFDKVFYETPVSKLSVIKEKYPFFFSEEINDSIWVNKMQNPLWRELYSEVQKKFGIFETQELELENLYKHIKYYFPKTKTPKVFTLINEMDYNSKVVCTDSLVLISLELYLGKEHKFYEFPKYLKQNFEASQMMADVVSSWSLSVNPRPVDKSLIAAMVYAGKELYLKDVLLPDYLDEDKIGYSKEQLQWCEANQAYMWQFFIQEKLLYSTDSRLPNRFINLAPFSKFYLEIDNESPGRVGTWIGWQIVRSFMKNNDVTLQQLLQMDAVEIFNKSKYKPRKNE
jgi:gliding motility-associated lipoprotein GldB